MKKLSEIRLVRCLFLITVPILFLHFAFAIIIREPYPSAIMPGFAGIKSNAKVINNVERSIAIYPSGGNVATIPVQEVFQNMSPVGSHRILDRMLFDTNVQQKDHPARKRYDNILSKIFGNHFMQGAIAMRSGIPSIQDKSEFKDWIYKRVSLLTSSEKIDSIVLFRVDIAQDIKTRQELERVITHKVRVF